MPDASNIVATTVAAMPEPATPYGPRQGQYDGPVSWAISGAVAFVGAVFWLRRRVSRDNTEIAKDTEEKNLVRMLREERDRAMNDAREAWARRTTDAELIASFRSENEYLKRDVATLTSRVEELQRQLSLVMNAIRDIRPDFVPPASLSA